MDPTITDYAATNQTVAIILTVLAAALGYAALRGGIEKRIIRSCLVVIAILFLYSAFVLLFVYTNEPIFAIAMR